ncbi:hypothetical protein ACFTUC_06325 [Streptomyces sp. NPDC056944]|uniref:hypothetical protein n=1 Tax=Streptomyces sp. NPDC056944 TaxID=3345972 RepID=UPI003638F7DD
MKWWACAAGVVLMTLFEIGSARMFVEGRIVGVEVVGIQLPTSQIATQQPQPGRL